MDIQKDTRSEVVSICTSYRVEVLQEQGDKQWCRGSEEEVDDGDVRAWGQVKIVMLNLGGGDSYDEREEKRR